MIVTVKTRAGKSSPSRATFASAFAYITRAGEVGDVHFSAAIDRDRDVPEQMMATAETSLRRLRSTPAYHAVFAWDRPIEAREAFEVVARGMQALGIDDHQWVAALHRDTDHVHVHVLANRVHPTTHHAWRPWRDYKTLGEFVKTETAHEVGLGLIAPPRSGGGPRRLGAGSFEAWHGQLSMESWARDNAVPALERVLLSETASWQNFHSVAAEFGMTVERRRSGITFVDRSSSKVRAVSGSGLGLPLTRLENVLGSYEAPAIVAFARPKAYGEQLGRFDLPTPAVRDPLVAPLFSRFVHEHQTWKGRAGERKEERAQILDHGRERVAVARAETTEALAILAPLRGEPRRVMRSAFQLAEEAQRQEIHGEQRQALATVTMERPITLFRSWLKERKHQGDATAGLAAVFLRKGTISIGDISAIVGTAAPGGTMQDPAISRLVDAYAAARAAGAPPVNPVAPEDFTAAMRELAEHERTAQWFEGSRDRISRFAGEDLSGFELAATAVILRDVVPPQRVAQLYAAMEPIVPLATVLGQQRPLTQDQPAHEVDIVRQAHQVIEPTAIQYQLIEEAAGALILSEVGPVTVGMPEHSEPTADLDSLREMAREIMSEPGADARFPQGFIDVTARERQHEDHAKGTFRAAPRRDEASAQGSSDVAAAPIDPDAIEAELQEMSARYRAYVESTGKAIYANQEKIFVARSESVEAGNRSRDGRHRAAGTIVRRLRADGALQDAYFAERETIARVTGHVPPLDVAAWLETSTYPQESRHRFLRACTVKPEAFDIGFTTNAYNVTTALARETTIAADADGKTRVAWKTQRGFIEDGDDLHVLDARERESARLALLVAAAKYEHGIEISGTDVFIDNILEAAVESDLAHLITNVELQDRIAELTARKAPAAAIDPQRYDTTERHEIEAAAKHLKHDEFKAFVEEKIATTLQSQLSEQLGNRYVARNFENIGSDVNAKLIGVYTFPNHSYALVESEKGANLLEIDGRQARALDARVGEGLDVRVTQTDRTRADISPLAKERAREYARER